MSDEPTPYCCHFPELILPMMLGRLSEFTDEMPEGCKLSLKREKAGYVLCVSGCNSPSGNEEKPKTE